jgi:hypothetical protein
MEKEKKEKGDFIYLFCPGGAFPCGVLINLLPLQSSLPSCCPAGSFPLFVWHDSAAETGAATDETSIATDSATAIAASAANVTLFVFISALYNVWDKRVIGYF